MRTIYQKKAEAMAAAKAYQRENGGVIFTGITADLNDEDTSRSIGTYGSVVVGSGLGSEPFGDTWEDFYYNL